MTLHNAFERLDDPNLEKGSARFVICKVANQISYSNTVFGYSSYTIF